MNTAPIDRLLYVDESGTIGGDPTQPWLVLAGVEVPTCQMDSLKQFYRDACQSFLPADVADDKGLDLKGSQLLRERPSGQGKQPPRWLIDMPFQRRIEFARQLLSAPYSHPGVQFYVSAIDTRRFPDSSMWGTWPAFVKELLEESCKTYLFALTEMIGDFAFHLNRELSSGVEELMYRPYDERRIEDGQVIIDENSTLKPKLQELEKTLRREREKSVNGIKLFKWRALDFSVVDPWCFCDSKEEKLLQFADVLAAIVKLKHTQPSLLPGLDRVYFQARLCFQGGSRSHFYPRENVNSREAMHWAGYSFTGLGGSAGYD